MAAIKGITVTLYEKTQTGTDEFGKEIYEETAVSVENVLVAPSQTTDLPDALNLEGKKAVYNLAIPKGDTHTWEDARLEFFGETWKVTGYPQEGIEELIPLQWNKKVTVERYG